MFSRNLVVLATGGQRRLLLIRRLALRRRAVPAGTRCGGRASADGYTLVVVTSSFFINPSLNSKIQYDPTSSFAPVSVIAAAPHVLVVHPSFPAWDMTEFVAAARAQPGRYSYASAGTGQSSHLAGELFKQSTGLDLVHVPFNGANPAMMSTIGNHTPICFISLPAAATYIKEGRLRALATTGSIRSEPFADVPTMAEVGFLPPLLEKICRGIGPNHITAECRDVAIFFSFLPPPTNAAASRDHLPNRPQPFSTG